MKKISDKYTIYGRKKGRKKINIVEKDFFVNCRINLETDIKKNKMNIIDVGSGRGENTLFLAKKNPDALIIAIEIFWDGNINLCKQLSKLKLYNVKIFSSNVLKLFDQLNEDDYFNEIWILFPDPWPKKKHYKRRLINDNFFYKSLSLFKLSNNLSTLFEKILTLYNLNFDSCLHKLIFPSQNISVAIISASGFFFARNNVFSPLPDPTSIIFCLFFFISFSKLILQFTKKSLSIE